MAKIINNQELEHQDDTNFMEIGHPILLRGGGGGEIGAWAQTLM